MTAAKGASITALNSLNFFLADVRDGLGPFLGVYLVGKNWTPDRIGLAMTLGGLASVAAVTPFGALADASRAKRAIVIVCAVLVIVASVSVLLDSGFLVVTGSQVASGIAGAAIGPALSGLTLGLVGQAGLPFQLGRNEAWNHAGNVGAATLAGVFGYRFGLPAVFVLMALMAAGSIAATLKIRPKDIDHGAARGLENGETDPATGMAVLLKCKPLLLFGATLFLFHLANAAMLPLLSQAATAAKRADPSVYTAGTIVVSQIAMIPTALFASRFAQRRGYSALVLAALAILPLRGLIAGLWRDPMGMIPVQVLDGVAAGLLGVATPGLVARILDGGGRFNTGLGAITALVGLGAALSTTLGGLIAKHAGYGAAFIGLASVAVLAFILFAASLPAFRAYASPRPAPA